MKVVALSILIAPNVNIGMGSYPFTEVVEAERLLGVTLGTRTSNDVHVTL